MSKLHRFRVSLPESQMQCLGFMRTLVVYGPEGSEWFTCYSWDKGGRHLWQTLDSVLRCIAAKEPDPEAVMLDLYTQEERPIIEEFLYKRAEAACLGVPMSEMSDP
jgi:hypothetical protein